MLERGDLYRVASPPGDPRRHRVVLIVSRQQFIASSYSTVTCVPVYSSYHGMATQVLLGSEQGLKHVSSLHCDELLSLRKAVLTNYVGSLSDAKMAEVSRALAVALAIEPEDLPAD